MILHFPVLFFLIFVLNSSVESYRGESFPVVYLLAENVVPEYSDVNYYLKSINKMLDSLAPYANDTDINRGLGIFYMNAILKRTIQENKKKIHEDQLKLIKRVLLQADNIMSHFLYTFVRPLGWDAVGKRVVELFKDEDLQIQAIGKFNRYRLQKWLLKNISINEFEQSMDELKMQKEEHLKIVKECPISEVYSLNIHTSDYCIGEIIYNPRPLNNPEILKPCTGDKFCADIVYENHPSIAYSLSHRMLVVMLTRHLRRCYLQSPEEDAKLLDILCAAMYRETVYLARSGYFNRDMWMEHIALCGLLGYEEFHRRHWFRKVVSWIDKDGCVAENFNLEANRTRLLLADAKNPEERQRISKRAKITLKTPCHWHQMALSLMVLAHGVRHAVHFSQSVSENIKDEL